MKMIKKFLALAGCVAALCITTSTVHAQGGRGNWDPAQMKQMRLDGLKSQMSITNDDEWKVIEPAASKVMDIGMEVMANRFRGMGRPPRNNNGGDNNNGGGQQRQRGGFGGTPSPEFEALQKALEDKAPVEEVKEKLAKLRESNAVLEAKLAAAQDELKKLLTARQEAVAVVAGLLK